MEPKHSFGGFALDRFIYEHEADGADLVVEEPVDDDPGEEPDAVETDESTEVEEPEAAEPEAWQGPSRQEWEQQQGQIAQLTGLAPVLERLGQAITKADEDAQPDPLAGIDELSPFDEGYTGKLMEGLVGAFGRMLDDRLGPVTAMVDEKAEAEAQQKVDELIGAAAKPHGDLIPEGDGRKLVEMLAYGVMVDQKTDGPSAIPKAAELVAGLVKQARQEGRDQLLAEQKRRADAVRDGGRGGAAVGIDAAGGDELAVTRRFMERVNAS